MLKKTYIAAALIMTMTLSVCGCSGNTNDTASQGNSENNTASATEQSTENPQSNNKFFAPQKTIADTDVDITASKGRFCFDKLDDKEKLYYEKIRKGVAEHYNAFFWNNRECSKETAEKLVSYVAYDYPEYFWYSDNDGGVDMMTDKIIKRIKFHYGYTAEEAEEIQPKLDSAVKAYTDSAKNFKNDYEKALGAYEYIIKNTEYVADGGATLDTLYDVASDKVMLDLWNVTGVFVDKKASARGYAQAFAYLMQQSGIECGYVRGEGNSFWNVVKLDGEWYCVDTAQGDSTDEEIDYSYFAITSEQMAKVHKADETFNAEIPECTAVANNYFVKNPDTKAKNSLS